VIQVPNFRAEAPKYVPFETAFLKFPTVSLAWRLVLSRFSRFRANSAATMELLEKWRCRLIYSMESLFV
jgi:hypothetical protein